MDAAFDAAALASQGVTALIGEMVRGGWETIREAFARFLRRDGQDAADRQLALFDEAEQILARADEPADDQARLNVERRLVLQLAAYLDRFPDMAEELRALLPEDETAPTGQGPALSAQHNTQSQMGVDPFEGQLSWEDAD
ncbi:hypothetical protein [Streptomyces sp. NPDC047070]|uniref:hypothetical protein n=1 Tax=Streptomyces sp. NPDC047070 TaxID=3154923 RepID=UPI003452F39B